MASLAGFMNMDMSYPGISIKVELTVLDEYLNVMEQGISAVCDSYIRKEEEKHKGVPHYEFSYIYEVANYEIPRVIKLPYLVTLYSLFESSTLSLLKYAQEKENKKISVKDIKGNSLISDYNKYIQHILNYEFCFNQNTMSRMSELNKLRNCVAHSNGNIDQRNTGINKLLSNNLKISELNGQLDISYEYLLDTFQFISQSIRELMEYMEQRYFEPKT